LLLPPLREVHFVSRLQQHNLTLLRKITQAQQNYDRPGHLHGRKALAVVRSRCACSAQKAWAQWRGVEYASQNRALEEYKKRKREEILGFIRKEKCFGAENKLEFEEKKGQKVDYITWQRKIITARKSE